MGEISKAVGQWIVGNVGWTVVIVLFVLSLFFKIAKKEVNPIGWILGLLGKSLTKDLKKTVLELKDDTDQQIQGTNAKITELRSDLDAFERKTNNSISLMQSSTGANCELLKTRLDAMEKSNDMQSVRQIKGHVLDFANSCRNGRKHTIEDFKNILAENDEYEALVEKYKLKNNFYTEDIKFIKEVYQKCSRENSFLA